MAAAKEVQLTHPGVAPFTISMMIDRTVSPMTTEISRFIGVGGDASIVDADRGEDLRRKHFAACLRV